MPYNGHRAITKPDGSNHEGWRSYTCGHCGRETSGAVIAYVPQERGGHTLWLQCTACGLGSVWNHGEIIPGATFGPVIEGLPGDVENAYQEARRCIMVAAYNGSVLICRKILMHIAVDKGAKAGDGFGAYIAFLISEGYITPSMKRWVELIQKNGNLATHQLPAPDRDTAESTLMFTAELLRVIYEMEYIASRYVAPQGS